MSKYKHGDRPVVKLTGGRIVEATAKAVFETTERVRLQVSFGDETAIYDCRLLRRLTDIASFELWRTRL
jgi:hypothetical protein